VTPLRLILPRLLSERQGKWVLTLFPPLLFQRIRVLRIGAGFRTAEVRVARSLFTRNLHGTTFGGTIFSAADPLYAIMYWQVMAREGIQVHSWLKSAQIAYLKPATTALKLTFELSDDDVARAREGLEREGRHTCNHRVEAIDAQGRAVAAIETEVYLRRPRTDDSSASSSF